MPCNARQEACLGGEPKCGAWCLQTMASAVDNRPMQAGLRHVPARVRMRMRDDAIPVQAWRFAAWGLSAQRELLCTG